MCNPISLIQHQYRWNYTYQRRSNGDHDYQANFELAQEYFDLVQAPDKAMLYFEDAGHMSPLYRSEELSEKIREIAARQ